MLKAFGKRRWKIDGLFDRFPHASNPSNGSDGAIGVLRSGDLVRLGLASGGIGQAPCQAR
jgi:hypothetical protein